MEVVRDSPKREADRFRNLPCAEKELRVQPDNEEYILFCGSGSEFQRNPRLNDILQPYELGELGGLPAKLGPVNACQVGT